MFIGVRSGRMGTVRRVGVVEGVNIRGMSMTRTGTGMIMDTDISQEGGAGVSIGRMIGIRGLVFIEVGVGIGAEVRVGQGIRCVAIGGKSLVDYSRPPSR